MVTRSRFLISVGILVLAGLALLGFRSRSGRASYGAVPVDRGEIADVVGATGTLQAVTTVQVGSQVSGTIASLGADFNSVVKKNQVIARLDPSLFQARVYQAEANLASARANVQRSRAAIDDAKQKYDRSRELAAQGLVTQSDLDSAKATYDGAIAQNLADQAAVNQSAAALNQAKLDLEHSIIQAPIDGVVLARNVDVGQTVAASLQAPTLFVIANDLSRMEVNATVDEADIGRVKTGQDVTFRVDAFSGETFAGRVEQIRLQPVITSNVVTYNTIITVDNSSLRLMPGMTATVSVVIESRKDVLRVPNTALRFRPEGYVEAPRPAGSGSPAAPGGTRAGGGSRRATESRPGRSGVVFVLGDDGVAAPTKVQLGLSDGRYVEVLDGLAEGDRVITGVTAGGGTAAGGPAASSNPFQPARPQPRAR
ncbi:MAG: efflux RND transporter periplasmic adaptor subunit [Vicinamibacteria bacterium]